MQSIVQTIGVMGVTVSLITGVAFAIRGYDYFSNQNTNVFLKTIYMMSWTYMSFVLGFVTTVSLPLVMMFVVFNMDKLNIIIKNMPSNTMMDHTVEDIHTTTLEAEENQDDDDEDDVEETHDSSNESNTSSVETTDHSDRVTDNVVSQNVSSDTTTSEVVSETVNEETPLLESNTETTQTEKMMDKTVEIKQELQNILETMRNSGSNSDEK